MISVLPKDLRRSFSSTAVSALMAPRSLRAAARRPRAAAFGSLNVIVASISPWIRAPLDARSGGARTRTAPKPTSVDGERAEPAVDAAACRASRRGSCSVEPSAGVELQVVDHLDQRRGADAA